MNKEKDLFAEKVVDVCKFIVHLGVALLELLPLVSQPILAYD